MTNYSDAAQSAKRSREYKERMERENRKMREALTRIVEAKRPQGFLFTYDQVVAIASAALEAE